MVQLESVDDGNIEESTMKGDLKLKIHYLLLVLFYGQKIHVYYMKP